jgi:HEAT repeat protein
VKFKTVSGDFDRTYECDPLPAQFARSGLACLQEYLLEEKMMMSIKKRWLGSTARLLCFVFPAITPFCVMTLGGCSGDSSNVEALAADLESDDKEVRYEAAKTLEDMGANAGDAVPELKEALQDPDDDVRYRAAKALSKVGSAASQAVPELGKALKDGNPDVRYYAAKALADQGSQAEGALQDLIDALKDTNNSAEMRYYVIKTLRDLGQKAADAVPILKLATKGQEKKVAQAAESALQRIQGSSE